MPVSDDELDGYHHQPGMSKAELRRSNKPIMEKRRRARINHCLDELKSLILDAMNKDPARHSKLEKADILEMTVKHLQTIQRQQLGLAAAADPAVVHKFKTGFHECAGEVGRYVDRLDGVEPAVKRRLVDHLASCVRQMGAATAAAPPFAAPPAQAPSDDVNNNGASASARLHQMVTGLRLVPSRLPTGEIALLLPNSQGLPLFAPPLDNQVSTTTAAESPVDRSRNSAFTAVSRDWPVARPRSPLPSPTSTTASSYDDDSRDGAFFSADRLTEVSSTSEHTRPTGQSRSPDPVMFRSDSSPTDRHILSARPHEITTKDSVRTVSFHDLPDSAKTVRPLTVITSNEMLKNHPQKFSETKRTNFQEPSDYSVKKDSLLISNPVPLKRPYQDDSFHNLLIKTSEFQVPQKIPKLHQEGHLQHKMERRSLHEIQIQTHSTHSQLNLQQERTGLLEIQNQPSASTSSEVARDMWRPW